jgi:glycyl-tRNA synthetase alpha subunit
MEQLKSALNRFIGREEERTRVSDATRNTYSSAAMAARERVLKLNQSITVLTAKLAVAIVERDQAVAVVAALESTANLFHHKS